MRSIQNLRYFQFNSRCKNKLSSQLQFFSGGKWFCLKETKLCKSVYSHLESGGYGSRKEQQ